jgi:S-adenosylmethionine hydrolase
MGIITLISDLGHKDYYLSAVKGAIFTREPQAIIVDITHDIPAFDILQAAFVLKNAYVNFPKGTVHIIGINSEATIYHPHVAVEYEGHYFIGADNGIFSLLFTEKPEKIIELNITPDSTALTFPLKDVFVIAACHLATGGTIEMLGIKKNELVERTLFRPASDSHVIRGSVLYIDIYGNIITNITQQLFNDVGKGRPFTIFFRKSDYNIDSICNKYSDVAEGEKLALFSTSGYLELAINKGQGSMLFGLKQNDTLRIEFHDYQNSKA